MNKIFTLKRLIELKLKSIILILLISSSSAIISQTVTVTAPVSSQTYCAGANVTVNYTVTSAFGAGNVFTAELSNAAGSFTSGVISIGTRTATGNNNIACTLPFTLATSSLYRIRITSSNPVFTSQSNGADLTINGLSIGTPTTTSLVYCQGEVFNVTYSQNCNFSNTGFNNVYTVQLSDAAGSFASPTSIGTRTANTVAAISCTMPAVPFGTGYRIRIVASNPVVTSPDNGSNITINVPSGTPSVAGNGFWNAYCFNAANNYTLNYQGYFTENNLSFDTRTRYTSTSYPASANTASGNAYAGCTFTNTNNYSIAFKRTNIPCGYYNITFAHDDEGRIFIDGAQVYYNPYIGGGVQQAYTGFISPTNTVEVRYSNTGGGPGFAAVNITTLSVINVFNPATICAGSTTTLTATNTSTVPLTFSWAPSAFASPTTGTATTVSPTVTTIFTVSATDAVSGCAATNTVQITVNPVATTTVAATSTLMCSGITQVTLTAGGAASYTWSPAAGLSAVNGNSVIANPTVTTTYTVSGSNNCNTVDASTLITVQTIPASPATTVFGNNVWNVYCYDGRAFVSYYGYYTENNLSFNSTTRWGTNSTPSAANGSSGLAYQGCNIPVDQHSTSHKRTNFTCGYYQIDIPAHDDDVTLLVNGVQVFQHIGCCDAHTNVWTGFLGPATTVEIRHQEGNGGSYVAANFVVIPYPVLSPPVTICAGTSASLTASPFIAGANYVWGPAASLTVTTTGTLVPASPTVGTNYTCTVTDPVSTCSAAASVSVTVNPLPTTTVSPTTGTISCSIQTVTLTAGGANTYSWSPSAGLSATTGNSVIASPTVTTIYTVTGNNNCAGVDATSTITVVPLITPTVFPNNVWNVYCYNDQTFTNYYGYYTHTPAAGYNFTTTTQWANGAAPSTATANANGTKYQGCTMSASNISLSFKRTNFACGTYSISIPYHDDNFYLYIDGTLMASHVGCCDVHTNVWVGALNPSSNVEFRLVQGGGGSGLTVTFSTTAAPASLSTWIGTTSNDWFTASNWCGSGVPNSTIDALIPNSKLPNYPVINASGAACRSLTVSAAAAATAFASALPAATLTINAGNSLDVYGNWINDGVVNASSTSTVNLLGTSSTSLSGAATETLGGLVINKTGTVTIPAGKVVQIAGSGIFTNGIVNQNGTFRFLNSSTTSGANNASYVNGQVIKVGTQAFTFPVGAGSFYRPISISAPSVATDHFTAQYFLTDASPSYTHTSKDATIDHIGRCEYWILNRTGGSSNVNVTLTWNTTSCGVTNLADLLVARWDVGQGKWKNEGNGGTTGNTTSGTVVSSGVVSVFSPFTLASLTTSNPLPIELVSFSCSNSSRNSNSLVWTTATESNNDYFAIERSANGAEFTQIAKVDGAGNSLSTLNYSYRDENPLKGISYYRLKQVDFNGKFTYSEICSVTNNGDGNMSFYPNPVRNTLTIDYEFLEKPKSNVVSVTDVTGKLVSVSSTFMDSKMTLDCSDLAEGIYFLKVLIGDKEVVNKFTVQK